MLLWLVTFIIITAISLALTIRSMRHFEAPADELISKSPFLVRNLGEFNDLVLFKLHDLGASQNILISVERLFKGSEQALIIFGPNNLPGLLPDLDLLELEDYLTKQSAEPKKTSLNQVLGFDIPITASLGFVRSSFLHSLELLPTEQFFWQLVIKSVPVPEKSQRLEDLNPHFQITARVLMVSDTAQMRVDLAKKILPAIQYDFGLKDPLKPLNTSRVFTDYLNRDFDADYKGNYFINAQEVLALLDLE